MRVLFDKGELHGLVPAGRFTIKADGSVEWHTAYSALTTHAGGLDDEVLLPGFDVGDAVDAVAFGDFVALAYGDDVEPRIEIVERATRKHRQTIYLVEGLNLERNPPRLAGLTPMEEWSAAIACSGSRPRELRLSASDHGFFVTAKNSGHIVRADDIDHDDIIVTNTLRVPGATENTVFAARAGQNDLVGIKWNGRHSDLFVVAPGNRVLGRWPQDEEVRWGMPAPVVIGNYVVTYSDDGPFSRQFALLELPTLNEIDHAPAPEWPNDMATDGSRFAAVSTGHLVIGRVENGKLVIDEQLTIAEIMKRGGVGPGPRSNVATDDGQGTRTWLPTTLAKLVVDGDELFALGPRGAIYAIKGAALEPVYEPFPEPGPGATAMRRFLAPTRSIFDARAGRLIVSHGRDLALVDRATKTALVTVNAEPMGVNAWIFGDGMVYVFEERNDGAEDEYVVRFVAPGHEPRELGRSQRSTAMKGLSCNRDGNALVWFELGEANGQYAFHVARFEGGDVTRTSLPKMAKAFAFDRGRVFTIQDEHLFEGSKQLTKEPLPWGGRTLLVHGDIAFYIEPLTSGGAELHPSKLWRIDVKTGERSLVSTATIGAISSLQIEGDTLSWLESRDSSMSFFKLGEDENVSAICSLPLARQSSA